MIDFRFNVSEIDSHLERIIEFTREWFEKELTSYFEFFKLGYYEFESFPFYNQNRDRCARRIKDVIYPPLNDVDIVFIVGGTCRIPFIQKWIKEQFPGAKFFFKGKEIIINEPKIIKDEKLEIITATGAAIHALQVLNGEVLPYIHNLQI